MDLERVAETVPEVQDLNVMEKMLAKGDQLRPKYKDFDFSKLDS